MFACLLQLTSSQAQAGYRGYGAQQEYRAPAAQYSAPAGDYGAQQGYTAPSAQYSASAYVPHVKQCFKSCPSATPCITKETGVCVPMMADDYAAASYTPQYTQAYNGAYDAPQSTQAYSQAQEAQDDGAEQREYRRLSHGTCPYGTYKASCNRVATKIPLWIGFFLLFLPALYFFALSYSTKFDPSEIYQIATGKDEEDVKYSRFLAGLVCMIASCAYLVMALGFGSITRCCDGRQFYYARYIDWIITTPIMIHELLERTEALDHEKWFLITMDILMVVAGLIGSLTCGSDKWAFFIFSMLCFVPVMGFLYYLRDFVRDAIFKKPYLQAVCLTTAVWMIYPIIWVLSEGTGTLCATSEAICYTILDVIAKSCFGLLLVTRSAQFTVFGSVVTGNFSML